MISTTRPSAQPLVKIHATNSNSERRENRNLDLIEQSGSNLDGLQDCDAPDRHQRSNSKLIEGKKDSRIHPINEELKEVDIESIDIQVDEVP